MVEEGLLSLDDPAKEYVPEIADIQVLEGFDVDGQALLRVPKTDITLDQLMLHTSGLSYEFFSEDDLKYRELKEIPTIISSTFDSIKSVLLYDPGERWGYGVSLDWIGKIVEAVRGKRLDEVMQERIFNPLDMNGSSFTLTPSW